MTWRAGPGGPSLAEPLGGETVTRLSHPDYFGNHAQLLPGRIQRIAENVVVPGPAKTSYDTQVVGAWNLTDPPAGPPSPTWQVPNIYLDPDGYAAAALGLRNDSRRANAFALRYLLTGDEDAAAAAVAQIEPWTGITGVNALAGDGTRLEWSCQWAGILLATINVRGSEAWTPELEAGLATVTNLTLPLCSVAFTNVNNWADWGVLFEMTAGVFLGNKALFRRAVNRWKYLIEYQIDENNEFWQEIHREGGGIGDGSYGLVYSSFCLLAKAFAAEVARANGVWLYDYVSPSGRTLRPAWERIAEWSAAPQDYPYNTGPNPTVEQGSLGHFEILHALWPTEHSQAVLDVKRPVAGAYSCFYLTATHAGLRLSG